MGKIVLKRMGAAGDVLLLQPIIESYISRGNEVNLITGCPSVLNTFSNFEVNGSYSSVDIDFDMVYENDPLKHVTKAYMDYAGFTDKIVKPNISLSEKHLEVASNIYSEFGDYAVFSLDTLHYPNDGRRIHGLSNSDWDGIITYLESKDIRCVFLTSNLNHSLLKHRPELFVHTPNIDSVLCVLSNASVFIGTDSLLAHLANSLNIPSCIFIGSVNPDYRYAQTNWNFHFLQHPCEKSGCYHSVKSSCTGGTCKLVGREYVKCCTYTKEYVQEKIRKVLEEKEV